MPQCIELVCNEIYKDASVAMLVPVHHVRKAPLQLAPPPPIQDLLILQDLCHLVIRLNGFCSKKANFTDPSEAHPLVA